MTDIKLGRIADSTPVRITISISPALNRSLGDYAALYEAAYGQPASLAELIPAILETFLASDRAFVQRRRKIQD